MGNTAWGVGTRIWIPLMIQFVNNSKLLEYVIQFLRIEFGILAKQGM